MDTIAKASAPIIAAAMTAIIANCLSLFSRIDRVSAFEAARFRSLRRSRLACVPTCSSSHHFTSGLAARRFDAISDRPVAGARVAERCVYTSPPVRNQYFGGSDNGGSWN